MFCFVTPLPFDLVFADATEGLDLLAALGLVSVLGMARELGLFMGVDGIGDAIGDPLGEALLALFCGVSSGCEEVTVSASCCETMRLQNKTWRNLSHHLQVSQKLQGNQSHTSKSFSHKSNLD